ncbi:MAG: small subunit ribosomal protein S20 [Parcubacteria group bacterium Athens1014_10]|nr:MAG: small subunit ribosomal protein S20 [Parcubacteria group bacterium Athens1014_10]TSD05150.1 MAG: small subunit ribosomal protein S20 [Parcubacteria group bacterium Athens0714_12]
MPIKKAAYKALRQNKKRALKNKAVKNKIKSLEKKFAKEIKNKDKAKLQAVFLQIQKALDKAVKNEIIKKNKASRKKSRLSKFLRQIDSVKS